MVGLGCGARSYTARPALLVRLRGQRRRGPRRSSTTTWPARPATSRRRGRLRASTRRSSGRRWLVKSLLRAEGVDRGGVRGPVRRRRRPTTSRSWPSCADARLARPATPTAGWAHRRGPGPLRRDRPRGWSPPRCARRWRDEASDELPMNLSILYRGPLASCNYDCPYCPFAKRRDSPERLRADRAALERFVDWVERNPDGDRLSVLFTPWGEGLTRSWYRDALVALSPPAARASGSRSRPTWPAGSDWLADADRATARAVGHLPPGPGAASGFLAACADAATRSASATRVGVVGLPEHLDEARGAAGRAARARSTCGSTPPTGHTYTRRRGRALDRDRPALRLQRAGRTRRAGHECRAGESVISVLRRRHGAPLPLHPDADWATSTTGRTARRCGPRPARNADLRLPHRLRAPQAAAALRRLRRRGAGAHPRLAHSVLPRSMRPMSLRPTPP